MSFRAIPASSDEPAAQMRTIEDRLRRLENGAATAGRVSFGPAIQIGDVLVTILPGAGTHRTVQFKNILSGATSTIVL